MTTGAKIVGVDLGTTLTKFAWWKDQYAKSDITPLPIIDRFNFASTAEQTIDEIIANLKKDGVTRAIITGINVIKEKELGAFDIVRPTGNHIDTEIRLQANGAHELIRMGHYEQDKKDGTSKPTSYLYKFLLVSIGTGTSYTFADLYPLHGDTKIERFPLGNAIGGGFIKGVMALNCDGIKVEHIPSVNLGPLLDVALDIKIKDMDPGMAGTPIGELPVAYLGNAKHDSSKQDIMQAVTNCVATTVFRDILLLSMIPREGGFPGTIVFVGTPIAKQGLLTNRLKRHFKNWKKLNPDFNFSPIFPERCEYAGALGALLSGK